MNPAPATVLRPRGTPGAAAGVPGPRGAGSLPALFVGALLAASAAAQVAPVPVPAAAAPADAESYELPRFFVTGERVGLPVLSVPRGDLRPPEPNLAPELLAIPGVYGHSRATDAMEPSIRGLGFDRVATSFNGVPLVNASPERTYSPVAVLGPVALAAVSVAKALPSVTAGPATTGGRLLLATADPIRRPAGEDFAVQLGATWNGARDGLSTRARFRGERGRAEAEASFFTNQLGDYDAPDGRRVAARLEDSGAAAALAWHGENRETRVDLVDRRLRRQDAVSLPLDGRNTGSRLVTVSDRWTGGTGALREVSWRAGWSSTDPYITSEARASALIFAQSLARSAGGGLTTVWRLAPEGILSLGADHAWQARRAIRTTPTGRDFIWPDARGADTGVFAEWSQPLAPGWNLRAGARADRVRSDARAADQLALGKPVREQYVLYNGPAAARVGRSEGAGAANLLVERRVAGLTAFLGAGFSAQPAAVTERYRALLNALGGDGKGGNAVELGNPALSAERKWALEAGGAWRSEVVDLEGTCYYYRVDDFILRTRVGTTLPPLAPMVVFGYRNIDAELYGAELAATFKPGRQFTVPVTLARSEGRNRATGVGLAEMPPWEATAAVRFHSAARRLPVSAEVGARLVGAGDNPAALENPLYAHTSGFALWHLRAGLPVGRHLRLEAGVENLLNRAYTEYLTPPVAPVRPASGNLLPGARIPGPRRSLWLAFTWQR